MTIPPRETGSRWHHLRRGQGMAVRVMRSSALTIFGYGGSQVLRLISNLLLTRLLYPEAFGLMGLVWVFMVGLANFTEIGIGTSILQNKRGDDPDFLNTAWTLQVIRGGILFVLACLLAVPAAQFYDAPQLAQLLPAVALTLLITALNPTRLETARRHLMLGRVTGIDLVAQIIGLTVGAIVAWATGSVWALVVNAVTTSTVQLILYTVILPGIRNRFRWEKQAVSMIVRFGAWIFLSTVAGFLLTQGDKIVLGKHLSLTALGIYNIGFFLASFPLFLGTMVIRRVLIPVYRERPPAASENNFRQLQKLRFMLTLIMIILLFLFAFLGPRIIHFLYDDRYSLSAGVLVLVAVMQIPIVVVLTYDQAALAAGDSKRFFVLAFVRASLMMAGLLVGVSFYGLTGALLGQGISMLLAYPVVVWLARHQGTWDPLHDIVFMGVGGVLGGIALWLNIDAIAALHALNMP